MYTVGHKKEPTYFCLQLCQKSTDFNSVFTDRFINERHHVTVWTSPSSPTSPKPNYVAALPCESKNTENVVLHRHITKENCIICIIASSEWTRVIMCLKFTYLGVLYSNAYVKRFMTSTTCKNAWCKLGLTLTRISSTLRLTSGMTIWGHVCVLVDTLNTCSDMTVHFCHSPEHWNCQCYLMHV